jgi:hypothetical protein
MAGYQRDMARRLQQPLLRRLAQLALALVLVLPIVSSAHAHGFASDAQSSCHVCTVAKHAPAVCTPSAAIAMPLGLARVVDEAPVVHERSGRCWRPAGRAPPRSSSTRHT